AADAPLDLVADRADGVDALAGRVVELPVQILLAGEVRAGVAAAHGDAHVGGLDGVEGEDLRLLGGDVDAHLFHRLDGGGVDLVGRCRSGGADFDAVAREVGEPPSGHLGAAGIVDADEEHRRLVRHGDDPFLQRSPTVWRQSTGRTWSGFSEFWGAEEAASPQAHVDEADQDRDLDERADDARERLAGGRAEGRDRDGDGELEVVAR
ncbi:hypothetical protein ADL26_03645, partial [Thermoactinomyces vulgaris]